MLRRTLESHLLDCARDFPVVSLTGPRQSGKTTVLKQVFGASHRYVSLEQPAIRKEAATDGEAFLRKHPPPVILDEVQHAPNLLSCIQVKVDEERKLKGRFLITGSQNLLMNQHVTQSLAGRVALLTLMPLSLREAAGDPGARLPWEKGFAASTGPLSGADLWAWATRGGYPELVLDSARNADMWYEQYIRTYLERDLRTLRAVGDLVRFQTFMQVLALRSGQLLNLASLARDLGVAVNTVKAWVSVLEASYQILRVLPYHENRGKQLVKTPKIYFLDVGILCHLAGLQDARQIRESPMAGAVFETAAVSEIHRRMVHAGIRPRLFFWRTSRGQEVDLLIETEMGPKGMELVPVEVKATEKPREEDGRVIRELRGIFGERMRTGYVVHAGGERGPLGEGVEAMPLGGM